MGGFSTKIMDFEEKQAHKKFETRVQFQKEQKMRPYQTVIIILVAKCLKLNDVFMYFTASPNLNAK